MAIGPEIMLSNYELNIINIKCLIWSANLGHPNNLSTPTVLHTTLDNDKSIKNHKMFSHTTVECP